MICEYYNGLLKESSMAVSVPEAFQKIEKARVRARSELLGTLKEHVLFAIRMYSENDVLECVRIFRNMCLSDLELEDMVKTHPNAVFEVLHRGTCLKACKVLAAKAKSREIRPITLKEANSFVDGKHRHHSGVVGCKFAIGLFEGDRLSGVAICGRPVSRYLDTGEICEITRVCTNGSSNACSMLYGACARIAQNMGYKKIITYTLKSENGASLKASNFTCEGEAGGTHWTGKRNRGQDVPAEMKNRWVKNLTN